MIKYLTENILPFWLEHAIDEEYGGIFTCLDKGGNIYGEEKSVWFQGRALYIFSYAYNNGLKNEDYLTAAKKIYEFLPMCGDENGRMYFTVTRDGKEIQKRRYYFSETFAAIGCCEYWLASGDPQARFLAEKYFDIAYRLYSHLELTTPKFNPDTAPYDALSPSMIMLSTAQILRKINYGKYDKIANETIGKILKHNTEYGLLENIGLNGAFINTPTGRILNPGHSLEAAWFLMAEGQHKNDASLMSAGKNIIDISMRLGYRNGGIIAFCDCLDKPATALEWDMQLWWPQCEAMIANRLCHEIFKEEKYSVWYKKIKEYAFTHFADNDSGEWYGYLHYDGTVANTLKGNIFKGPFHIPRMILLIDRIENGKTVL